MSLPLRTLDPTDAAAGRPLPASQVPRTPRADAPVLRRIERRASANEAVPQVPANDTGSERRIARMLRDCDASAAPALLLAAVCAALAALVGLGALLR
jgi:hypothetical protein